MVRWERHGEPVREGPTGFCRAWSCTHCTALCLLCLLCPARVNDREEKYYADGEDAYDMRRPFTDAAAAKSKKSPAGKAGGEKAGPTAEAAAAAEARPAGGEESAGAAEGEQAGPAAAASPSAASPGEKKKHGKRR